MKNFTKTITNKTLFKTTRWLIMALMLLMGTSAMLAANTTQSDGSYRLYFKFSGGSTWWNNSGCYHYAWVWANGGAGQVQRIYKVGTTSNASTASTTDVFYMNIPNGMTLYGMILFRGTDAGPANGSTTWPEDAGYSWHNKTGDIVLPNNISTYNLVTAVTDGSTNVTQNSSYTTVSLATTTLSASGFNSGSGTQADPYVYDENGTMKLTASATIDDHNFTIQLAYGSSTATISSGGSKSIDVSLTTASSATAYAVTYTPLLGGSTSYKGTASTKTIYYKTAPTCTTVETPNVTADAICAGSTATLTLTNRQDGVTYRLNSTTGDIIFSSEDTYTTPTTLDANTTYTIYASHDDACTNNVEGYVTVTVNPIPSFTTNPTDKTMCAGETSETNLTTLSGVVVANGSPVWYNAQTGGSTVAKADIVNGGTYWVAAENSTTGCKNATRKKFVLAVKSAPQTPSLSADRDMLNTTNTTATLTIGNYVSGVTYTLYEGENSTGETTTGTTFTVTEGGIYKVKGTNTNNPSGCQETEFSDEVTINVCPTPAEPQLTSTPVTACDGVVTADGYITIGDMGAYTDDDYTFTLGGEMAEPDANGKITISSVDYTEYTVTVTNSCGNQNSADVEIAINDNAPVITGNTSFQPGGSTTLTSDKGASTTWKALDGGNITSSTTGTSIEFTANENGTYPVQATYNGCSTTVEIKVQDDLYVWVRRPIKKETAYDQFYHEDQNSEQGGDLFYKEFASLSDDYTQYNQGGKAAEQTCTDKDGYTWYGFVVSKEAIENNYYFTVHAPNDGGEQGDAAKYNGYYTHTYATQLVDMDADLYFVMDETPSNVPRGWNINTPVVVRASGDASFNGNNFADFVPLYVKDANICGKEVVSFEWQKSDAQNGTYTTYKSGEGINNIRTREAGWYRCVVTYGDGKGTATSNAIQVTNAGGTSYSFTSKLPILMVNTNGVGFPNEPASGFPSVDAENLKAKVSVDVIIKKGEDIVYDRKARMNYRGSSSLNFKKKSYAFCPGQDSCVFDKSRHDYVKTKKAKMFNVLGDNSYSANDKDWVLYAATPDPSMMRNRLVFDLYQQMRPGEWGVHSTYVELIVDGEYQGVYVFMDKITANEGRVNITNSDGFIVKFDKTDVADRVEKSGDQKTFATTRTGTKNTSEGITSYDTKIDQRFEIEYPEKEDIEDAGGNWEAFYKGVQQRFEDFETALANKQYDKVRSIIDYDSWADWFILSEFIKNQDGFRASNIFIYNGGKIIATPLWDQELSMDNRTRIAHGSSSEDGLLSTTSSVYSDAFPAPFWFTGGNENITGGLLNDPCFVALVKSKWDEYQAGVLSASNCSTLVAKYHGELDDDIRSREATKWPYTQAARGTTNSGKYMGYYNDTEGDPSHYSYNASKNAITSYASNRSTELKDNVGGLGEAIFDLNGETLIFNIKPSVVETSPWQQSIVTVNAPEGYEYTLDYSALTAVGAEVKENGNAYTIKIPRPSDWEISGNGTAKKETYTITATIDAEGENSCGAKIENTANATINVNDVTEDCDPPIVKP